MEMRFSNHTTPIARDASFESPSESYGLFGETVDILETVNGFLKIKNKRDDYMGYVHSISLERSPFAATHYVIQQSTLIFEKQDIKSPMPFRLPFGGEVMLEDFGHDKFVRINQHYFGIKNHFALLQTKATDDFVSLAETLFVGAPYLWAGRSPDGTDCSGLVQMAAFGAGIFLPRDSGPQEKFLGEDIQDQSRTRGDIVFWKGHVGLMVNESDLIHANAHHMKCVIEPLSDVTARAEGNITSVKRLK